VVNQNKVALILALKDVIFQAAPEKGFGLFHRIRTHQNHGLSPHASIRVVHFNPKQIPSNIFQLACKYRQKDPSERKQP